MNFNKANIKLVTEDGTFIKTLTNLNLNFSNSLDLFKRNVEISLRLAPDDPVYELKKLSLKSSDDAHLIEVNQELLFKETWPQKTSFVATVAIVPPQKRAPSPGRTPSRSRSIRQDAGRTPSRSRSIRQDENASNNATPKNSGRMPSPSPRTFRSFSAQQQTSGITTASTPGRREFAPSPLRSRTPGKADKRPAAVIRINEIDDNEDIWKQVHSPVKESIPLDETAKEMEHKVEPISETISKSQTPKKRPVTASPAVLATSSIFPLGMTGGEARVAYDNNIRGTRFVSPMKRSSGTIPKSPFMSRKTTVDKKGKDDLVPSSDFVVDGRPSIATMEAQWRFLKENFTSGSSEELEWIMLCKQKNGALKFARRKLDCLEDKYFECLAQIEDESAQLGVLSNESPLQIIVSRIAKFSEEKDEISVRVEQEMLSKLIETDSTSLNKVFVENMKIIRTLANFNDCKLSKIDALASVFLTSVYPNARANLERRLGDLHSKSCELSADIEKWTIRETQTHEYNDYMKSEEKKWLIKEASSNLEALLIMRSLIPINISEISTLQILDLVREKNGLCSYELANELKSNRLLHWLVMHPDNIASYPNFLMGQNQQYFENLESLDLVELRALVGIIPETFENDNDGKKAAWRSRLIARAKLFVAQNRGDEVKGPWCLKSKKRLFIKLRPLTSYEIRKKIYFHHTSEISRQKIKQFDTREMSLQSKREQLSKAKVDVVDKKREYKTILSEMRDPELKSIYGKEVFTKAKEISKIQSTQAEKLVKKLDSDIKLLEKNISDREYSESTYKQYIESLNKRYSTWHCDEILIEGSFNSTPDIQKVVGEVIKCRSLDDELDARRCELESLRNNSIRILEEEELSASVDMSGPHPGRVLEKTDPDLLKKLESMYSPKVTKSNRSMTDKTSKSSLIQQLVQNNHPLDSMIPANNHQISFLDAIRGRANDNF